MIKVLVVDDEIRQRQSIIRYVDWQQHGMEVIGEAEDAEEALRLSEISKPDLLITDIRLIGRSGLELAAEMRKQNPLLKLIMVTGYEEFEYAKTAVSLNVAAFLVKPVDFGLLAQALDQIRDEHVRSMSQAEEQQQLNLTLQTYKQTARTVFINNLLHGLYVNGKTLREQAQSLGLLSEPHNRKVFVIVAKPEEELSNRVVIESVSGLFGESIEEDVPIQGVFILRMLPGSLHDSHEQALQSLAARLTAAGLQEVAIGVGSATSALEGLADSYRQALRAVNQRLLGYAEPVFHWEAVLTAPASSPHTIEEQVEAFLEMLASGDSETARRLLGELMRHIVGDIQLQGAALRNLCLDLATRVSLVLHEAGIAQKQLPSEKEIWTELFSCNEDQELLEATLQLVVKGCEHAGERKRSHAQVIVAKAIAYMNEHYMSNLSLRIVADAVFLSPNYLGALLRTELGISFTDQLTAIRIAKAKELLSNPELKLYEVAACVGYHNFGHFSNVFKRTTGVTPKDYRTQALN